MLMVRRDGFPLFDRRFSHDPMMVHEGTMKHSFIEYFIESDSIEGRFDFVEGVEGVAAGDRAQQLGNDAREG